MQNDAKGAHPSRRSVLAGGIGAAAVATWTQIGFMPRAAAAPSEVPIGFPEDIDLYRRVFRNWDTTIETEGLWTCKARNPAEVVTVVNWAADAGYRIRPQGFGHSWSPIVVGDDTSADSKIVLVDTSELNKMSIVGSGKLRVQAGAEMQTVLEFLARNDRCFIGAPAPGNISVGGVLAINGHGTNLPGQGEDVPENSTYGTISNTVIELTAVVWDEIEQAYALRTYQRTDADISALLVSLGRTFITEVVMQTVSNYNIRCRNSTSIHRKELFASPSSADGRTLSSLLDRHGRVGIIWFAMTDYPWIQTWDVTPKRPLLSRPTWGPYNYPFADNLPDSVASLASQITRGAWHLTPAATSAQLAAVVAGLSAFGARDMWGEAKNFIHFVKPTTLRVSAGSHVVITRRDMVQQVVHDFTEHYRKLIEDYRREGDYPANNTCEIRVTGLDYPEDTGIPGARTATLSGAAPVPGRPDLDTAVWLDVLNLPGTPKSDEFFMGLESWFINLPVEIGIARPEWAKRFATSTAGPWTEVDHLERWIPQQVAGWSEAIATLDRLDARGVFRAEIHDRLMPRT